MKKIMLEKDEKEFVEMVIGFAKEKSMTVSNIKEAVEKVIFHMSDNAVLEREL